MKNFLAIVLFAFFLTLVPAYAEAEPLRVVATFSILGDLVKQVGGDYVDVKTLVGADNDMHTYKPTPGDSKALAQSDLVVENGLGFEGWIDRMVSASGYKGPVVIASEGIVPRQRTIGGRKLVDPHAWQDVSNARLYVKNIAAALGKALPEKSETLNANAKAYDAKLEKLDMWVKTEMEQIPTTQRKIITSHDAFGYFGAAYSVTFISAQGMSTEIEPTAAQIAKLIEQIRSEKIKRVFFENMANPKLVSQLAKDAGASAAEPVYSDALSNPKGPAATYTDMFRTNVDRFKEAMMLNGNSGVTQ